MYPPAVEMITPHTVRTGYDLLRRATAVEVDHLRPRVAARHSVSAPLPRPLAVRVGGGSGTHRVGGAGMGESFPRRQARTRRFTLGVPRGLHFILGGR